jgi:hypothetical protein
VLEEGTPTSHSMRLSKHFLFQGGTASAKAQMCCVMNTLQRKGRLRGVVEKTARQAGDDDIPTNVSIWSRQPTCTARAGSRSRGLRSTAPPRKSSAQGLQTHRRAHQLRLPDVEHFCRRVGAHAVDASDDVTSHAALHIPGVAGVPPPLHRAQSRR